MANLDILRSKIDSIDEEMAKLFEQRMEIAKEIAIIKRENGVSVLNETRENFLKNRNVGFIKDESLKSYYLEFLNTILDISKSIQKQEMNDK